jgi:hypothetical protein
MRRGPSKVVGGGAALFQHLPLGAAPTFVRVMQPFSDEPMDDRQLDGLPEEVVELGCL